MYKRSNSGALTRYKNIKEFSYSTLQTEGQTVYYVEVKLDRNVESMIKGTPVLSSFLEYFQMYKCSSVNRITGFGPSSRALMYENNNG